MKTFLLIPIAFILLCSHAFAANPAFTDFYGTNGIIIRTNGNKVQVDGSALASSNILANANIWTNENGRIRPIIYPTFRIYPTNDSATSPILIMGGSGASNWMATGYGGTLRDYDIFSASIGDEGDLDTHNIGVASAQDTTGNRYGYAALETKTNKAMIIAETLVTGAGTQRFVAGYDSGVNFISLQTNTVEAFRVDGAGGVSFMKAVPQNWPDAQGAASTALTNDGAGNFGWAPFVGSVTTGMVANANIWTNDGTFIRPVAFPTNAMQRNADGSIITGAGVDGYLSTLFLTKTSAEFFPLMAVTDTNELEWNFHVGQLIDASLFSVGGLSVSGVYTPASSRVNSLLELKAYGPVNNTLVSMEANNVTGLNYGSISILNPAGTDITLLASEQVGASIRLGTVFSVTNDGNVSIIRNVAYGWPTAQGGFATLMTNDGSGNLGWGSSLHVTNLVVVNNTILSNVTVKGDLIITNIVMGGVNLRTNQYTTNISGTPVVGSLWFDGTDFGTFVTNGQRRASIEWIPINQSLRVGALGNIGVVHHQTLNTSNFWDSPNVGRFTYAFGSNQLINAQFSSILGGFQNIIYTNASNSVIVAGFNNIIKTNAHSSVISGGLNNHIHVDANTSSIGGGSANEIQGASFYGTIGGGASHVIQSTQGTIGGGNNNVIATSSSSSTISGGRDHRVNSSDSFIGGGHINQIRALGAGATIGGGDANDIGGAVNAGSTYSFIGGGNANVIDGFGNTTGYGVIAGGQQNHIEAGGGWNTIGGGFKNDIAGSSKVGCIIDGGISNVMTGNFAAIMGNYITNSQDKAIEIGFGSEGGNNRKLRVDGNGARVLAYAGSATVGGTYLITNTPIASAGASETNLQVVTVGAHVLTNANDRLLVRSSGRFAATSNTKQITLVYGSEDVFDSGAFVANTGAWTLDCEIIRTGNTSQSCNCSFNGGTNVVYVRTSALDLVQTNGIATVLKITGTAAGNGDITNRSMTVTWMPSP